VFTLRGYSQASNERHLDPPLTFRAGGIFQGPANRLQCVWWFGVDINRYLNSRL